jgi:predicted RNA binding protein YcfA (HicA-like mRNA interferase family)
VTTPDGRSGFAPAELPDLPVRKVFRALDTLSFKNTRTTRTHAVYRRNDGRTVIVPIHGMVKRGALASIVRQAGLTPQEFLDSPALWRGADWMRSVPVPSLDDLKRDQALSHAASRYARPTKPSARRMPAEFEAHIERSIERDPANEDTAPQAMPDWD